MTFKKRIFFRVGPVALVALEASGFLAVSLLLGTLITPNILSTAAKLRGPGVIKKGVNRWALGLGMIPRGEVGLIFASIGSALVLKGEWIISGVTYSAVVIMVIVTTFLAPPLLKWSLASRRKRESDA